MAIPLSVSRAPLVFDTLSAIGVRHYHGGAPAIYTQGRAYFFQTGLRLSLAAFERDPAATSAVGLALAGAGGQMLWLTLAPRALGLKLCSQAPPPDPWAAAGQDMPPPAARRFAGEDEQGWYWGAQLELDAGILSAAGCGVGQAFGLALFKLDMALPGAWGASFKPADPAVPLRCEDFPAFEPVDY